MTSSAGAYGAPIDILHPEPSPDSILEAALHFLKRFGWVKGTLGGKRKLGKSMDDYDFFPACSVGAINAVTAEFPEQKRTRLRIEARALLMNEGIKSASSIESWNDRETRTQEQVFQAFRNAVQAARA